ncbi:hypothetical protein CVT24_007431 [Panaeolus cyanescens]|uniref:Clathrin/coatomer adaptor adaptin-like N-terminal domain-containing protein n=1 Tax=Panaeolus cyanescens TaxID=181874 RepID=A0A409W9R5_9AGAR|nr:hypothetical protein CVT24_007431 [Panaeolus cyanescens]
MTPLAAVCIFIFSTIGFVDSLVVSISDSSPSGAITLSPSLLSFSIEQDRWTDWVGATQRNDFFFNTLDNLAMLTGEPPQIRIGANSEDHTNFGANIPFSQAIFPSITPTVPYPEATNITVGDGYYQTAKFLPPNTHVIWGLNLGQNNLTSAFLNVKSLIKGFSAPSIRDAGIVLDAIEIGNEPDLYSNNGARSKSYTSAQYVEEWTTFASNVTAAAKLTAGSRPQFWGAAFAGSSHSNSGFSPQAIFSEGILVSAPGKLISTLSQHRYSGSFCSGSGGLLQDLMTKSTIRGNLSVFSPDIAATRAKGLDYVLGETNSYSCHGAPGVSNTAGAALWTLDYLLYAAQIGISRVFFHVGIGFKYNLVQPVSLTHSIIDGSPLPSPLPPHVQPQYYAAIIAAEAIGQNSNVKSVELAFDDPRLAGYAFYEAGKVVRAIIINSQAFFTTTSTARGQKHVEVSGLTPSRKMTIKRLRPSYWNHLLDPESFSEHTRDLAIGRGSGASYLDTSDDKTKNIRKQLDSTSDREKLDAMKRLVALISKGRNVSEYFAQVVKNVASQNLEIRKLVYIYLLRYAEHDPDLALLSINTFQKDLTDSNPLIRAMALRVLSGIKVPMIGSIVVLAIKKCAADISPYVRKAAALAIPKCYELDNSHLPALIEVITSMLKDRSPLSIGSVVVAFEAVCPTRLDLLHQHYRRLCKILLDVDEWGQVGLMNLLLRYVRTMLARPIIHEGPNGTEEELDKDLKLLLDSVDPVFLSRNPSVVLAAAKVFFYVAPPSYWTKFVNPVLRLLLSSKEQERVALTDIYLIAKYTPELFSPHFSRFLVRADDPQATKILKIRLLSKLINSENYPTILREFINYSQDVDDEAVSVAIHSLGNCAVRIPESVSQCLTALISMIKSPQDIVVTHAVMVLKYLVQLQLVTPTSASFSTSAQSPISIIAHLARKISDIKHAHARACVIWLVGQYAASNEKSSGPEGIAPWAPDVLREMAKNFTQESSLVKLQVLTLAAKLMVLSTHDQTLLLLSRYVFSLARYDLNYDVRDRGRTLASLLLGTGTQMDGIQSEDRGGVILRREQVKLVLFEGKSGIMDSDECYLDDSRILLGSLSRVTGKSMKMDDILPDWLEKGVESKIRDTEEEKAPAPPAPMAISSTGFPGTRNSSTPPVILTPTDVSRPSSSNGAKGAFKDLDAFYAEDDKEEEEEEEEEEDAEEESETGSEGDDDEEEEDEENEEEQNESKGVNSENGFNSTTGQTDDEGETEDSSCEDETNGLILKPIMSRAMMNRIPPEREPTRYFDAPSPPPELLSPMASAENILPPPVTEVKQANVTDPSPNGSSSPPPQTSAKSPVEHPNGSDGWLPTEEPKSMPEPQVASAAPAVIPSDRSKEPPPAVVNAAVPADETARPSRVGSITSRRTGASLKRVGSAFANGAGTTGPEATAEPDEELENRIAEAHQSLTPKQRSKVRREEAKHSKRLSRIIKEEAKTEKKSLAMAISDLENLQKHQKAAIKSEARIQSVHQQLLTKFKKQEAAYLNAKNAYDIALAQLQAEEQTLETLRQNSLEATERVQEKAAEVDRLRTTLAVDARERELKLGELKGKPPKGNRRSGFWSTNQPQPLS